MAWWKLPIMNHVFISDHTMWSLDRRRIVMAEFWEESQCIPTFSIKKICNFFPEKCLFELGRICQILLWEMEIEFKQKKKKPFMQFHVARMWIFLCKKANVLKDKSSCSRKAQETSSITSWTGCWIGSLQHENPAFKCFICFLKLSLWVKWTTQFLGANILATNFRSNSRPQKGLKLGSHSLWTKYLSLAHISWQPYWSFLRTVTLPLDYQWQKKHNILHILSE